MPSSKPGRTHSPAAHPASPTPLVPSSSGTTSPHAAALLPPRGTLTPTIALHRVGTVASTHILARRVLADEHTSISSLDGTASDLDLRQPNCLIADSQTGGVGRTGNPWISPRGGLWLTLLWPIVPSTMPAACPRPTLTHTLQGLGLKVGMAVLDAVRAVLTKAGHDDEAARLKWPNDVLINNRKTAGMICEVSHASATSERPTTLLIGVGINADFAAAELPEHLRMSATTLRDVLNARINIDALRDDLLRRLSVALLTPGLPPTTLAAAYAALYRSGERHTVTLADGSRLTGVLAGLSPEGLAVLRLDDGSRLTLASGVIESPSI